MQKTVTVEKQKSRELGIIHYPNLRTVLMVEEAIKKADGPIKREELKRKLPKEVMHQTLNLILKYLEDRGMIYDGRKGIIWTYNPSPKFQEILDRSVRVK